MDAREYTDRYAAAQVTAVDRERLLLLVLEGGLRFLRLARQALAAGDLTRFGESLRRAQAIIGELLGTLDRERGGTIAAHLARLYDFMLHHLTAANVEKDVAKVDEVITVFGIVAEAYRTIIERNAAAAVSETVGSV
jgi:flagellar protein FliS